MFAPQFRAFGLAALTAMTFTKLLAQESATSSPSRPVPSVSTDTKVVSTPSNSQIKIETQLFEITEAAWKKISPELILEEGLRSGGGNGLETGPANLSSQFPELDKEKQTFAELAAEMTRQQNSPNKSEASATWKCIEFLARERRETLIRTLNKTEGCSLVSAPALTMKNGEQGTVTLLQNRRHASASDQDRKSSRGVSSTESLVKDCGITLLVTPEIGPANETIDLQIVIKSVTLLGFIGPDATAFVPADQAETLNIKSPVFSRKSVKTECTVWDDQSVVYGVVQMEVLESKRGHVPDTERKIRLLLITSQIVSKSPRLSSTAGN